MILYIRKETCSDQRGIPETLAIAACVQNSMKFKITYAWTMCTCSEMSLIQKYVTVPEAKNCFEKLFTNTQIDKFMYECFTILHVHILMSCEQAGHHSKDESSHFQSVL